MQNSSVMDRRDFFRHGGRLLLLGLGALAGSVLFRRKQVAVINHRCVNEGICSGCGDYPDCGLPQARSRRQVLERSQK